MAKWIFQTLDAPADFTILVLSTKWEHTASYMGVSDYFFLMSKFDIFLVIAILPHLVLAGRTQVKIIKTTYLNESQKIFNSALNWIIPYAWGFIIRSMIVEPKIKVVTKNDRKRNPRSNSDNWEGLTGYGEVRVEEYRWINTIKSLLLHYDSSNKIPK